MKLNEKIAASISAAALGTAVWAVPALACEPAPNPCPDGYTLKYENLNHKSWVADADYVTVLIGVKNHSSMTYDDVSENDTLDPPGQKRITYVCVMPPAPSPTPSEVPTTSPSPSYIEPSIHETTLPPTGSAEPSATASPTPSYIEPSVQETTITPTSSEEPASSVSPTPAETTDTQVLSAGPATAVSGTPTYTG